jgi:hypothetical protein
MYEYDPELQQVTTAVISPDRANDQGGDRSIERRQGMQAAEPDPTAEGTDIQWTPEHELRLAILQDAIDCICLNLKRPRQNPEILARQAEFWVSLDDWNSPFSFNNVCEALGLDPSATRENISTQGKKATQMH